MTNIDPDDAAAVRNIRKARAILHDWGWDPEKALRYLAAGNLIATPPRVICTRDEFAALDPDTLVTLALPEHDKWPSPQVQAWPAPVAHRLDLTWSGPVVIIATGEHVRAARQALRESTDAVD